jgi:hypothetical protein
MKGLSQILYLIIAASVLMIAALSLVFMLNDGLSGIIDLGGETDTASCERQVEQRCADGASTVSTPNSCLTENADGSVEVIGTLSTQGVGPQETSCTSFGESSGSSGTGSSTTGGSTGTGGGPSSAPGPGN